MGKVKIITADQAAALVEDNTTVTTSGFVASGMPEALTKALEKRFLETGSPKNLTLFYAAAQGNRDGSGADHFAHEGMTKRVIGGHWNMGVPTLGQLVLDNKIEGYNPAAGHSGTALPCHRRSQTRRDHSCGIKYICRPAH